MSALDESAALEREFEESARRRRRTTRIVYLVLAGLAALPFAWYTLQLWLRAREDAAARAAAQLTPQERAEAAELLKQAERVLGESEAEFRSRMTPEAMAQVQEGTEECPYALDAPTGHSAQSYVTYGSIDTNYFGSTSYATRKPGEPVESSVELGGRRFSLEQLGKALQSGTAEKTDLRQLRGMSDPPEPSVIFIVESEQPPLVSAGIGPGVSYTAGHVSGRAYLYSFTQKRIVCAGTIEAENSPKVDIRFSYMKDNFLDESSKRWQSAKAALERDMVVQIRRAIATSLRAVPRPETGAPSNAAEPRGEPAATE